jgi:murein endopeptidase
MEKGFSWSNIAVGATMNMVGWAVMAPRWRTMAPDRRRRWGHR